MSRVWYRRWTWSEDFSRHRSSTTTPASSTATTVAPGSAISSPGFCSRAAQHEIVTSLAELRRAAGLNQTELAQRWGHHQPHVSKIENNPTHVELATLAG
jgi:DNA-binding XRE family transcriptional regulator